MKRSRPRPPLICTESGGRRRRPGDVEHHQSVALGRASADRRCVSHTRITDVNTENGGAPTSGIVVGTASMYEVEAITSYTAEYRSRFVVHQP